MPEERNDVMPNDQEATSPKALRGGLSPTVERMFGALVDSDDETGGDSSAESETKSVSPPNS